jgi:hypothetical protein
MTGFLVEYAAASRTCHGFRHRSLATSSLILHTSGLLQVRLDALFEFRDPPAAVVPAGVGDEDVVGPSADSKKFCGQRSGSAAGRAADSPLQPVVFDRLPL